MRCRLNAGALGSYLVVYSVKQEIVEESRQNLLKFKSGHPMTDWFQ